MEEIKLKILEIGFKSKVKIVFLWIKILKYVHIARRSCSCKISRNIVDVPEGVSGFGYVAKFKCINYINRIL